MAPVLDPLYRPRRELTIKTKASRATQKTARDAVGLPGYHSALPLPDAGMAEAGRVNDQGFEGELPSGVSLPFAAGSVVLFQQLGKFQVDTGRLPFGRHRFRLLGRGRDRDLGWWHRSRKCDPWPHLGVRPNVARPVPFLLLAADDAGGDHDQDRFRFGGFFLAREKEAKIGDESQHRG